MNINKLTIILNKRIADFNEYQLALEMHPIHTDDKERFILKRNRAATDIYNIAKKLNIKEQYSSYLAYYIEIDKDKHISHDMTPLETLKAREQCFIDLMNY